MKKLFALLLALCLMCGVAVAEEAADQTLHLSHFSIKMPAEWNFEFDALTGSYTGQYAGVTMTMVDEPSSFPGYNETEGTCYLNDEWVKATEEEYIVKSLRPRFEEYAQQYGAQNAEYSIKRVPDGNGAAHLELAAAWSNDNGAEAIAVYESDYYEYGVVLTATSENPDAHVLLEFMAEQIKALVETATYYRTGNSETPARRFAFDFASFETPEACIIESVRQTNSTSHTVSGYVEALYTAPDERENFVKHLPFSIRLDNRDKDILARYGSLQRYANGGMSLGDTYKKTHRDVVTENGFQVVRQQKSSNEITYIWCLGNVGVKISFSVYDYSALPGVRSPGEDFYLNEIVEPIISSFILPDGTTAAASAEAEAKAMEGRIKVGNCNFALPEGMAESDRVPTGYCEVVTCRSESDTYRLMIGTINYYESPLPTDALGDKSATTMYWALQLIGLDAESAYDAVAKGGSLTGFPNGQNAWSCIMDSSIVHSQYYRGTGIFIISIPRSNEAVQPSLIAALDMLKSLRMDGVSEEQMAADAEAARVAAEQAAAQKYIVITNSSANIRSGPGGDYDKLTTARQGDTFPLIREEGNWYVIDINGQTGYVTKSLSAIQ